MRDIFRKLFATQHEVARKARLLARRNTRDRAVMIVKGLQQCTPNPIKRHYWYRVETILNG